MAMVKWDCPVAVSIGLGGAGAACTPPEPHFMSGYEPPFWGAHARRTAHLDGTIKSNTHRVGIGILGC